ncbi:hypothetical protein HY750_00585 [Candidatus Kuenenbacteria bacterium]|nr:hypothetical protein [Candidatus Kuenenbacteria bacterium]
MSTFKKSASIFLMTAFFVLGGVFVFGNISEVKAQETPSIISVSPISGTSNDIIQDLRSLIKKWLKLAKIEFLLIFYFWLILAKCTLIVRNSCNYNLW